ncbi:hypothetical protein BH23ACT5_BH23ACT5_18910 [soil metagenome]
MDIGGERIGPAAGSGHALSQPSVTWPAVYPLVSIGHHAE